MSTMRESDAKGFVTITEGSASIQLPQGEVFYNPVQQFNRDLSIAVISTYLKTFMSTRKNGVPMIFEGLAATGLRSIRYLKEIPEVKVIANDIDPDAVEVINRNIFLNCMDDVTLQSRIQTTVGDAIFVMHDLKRQGIALDIIDLDPYGSAAPFLDAAVQTVSNGGLLCVTCTDLAVLCAGHPETCFSKYGGLPIKGDVCHEGALRLVLNALDSSASRYKRTIIPLMSCSIDFYVRLFVLVKESAKESKLSSVKRGVVGRCVQCKSLEYQPFLVSIGDGQSFSYSPKIISARCDLCGSRVEQCGPAWIAPMHSKTFAAEVNKFVTESSLQTFGTVDRIKGMATLICEELEIPFFVSLPEMASFLKSSVPPLVKFRSALLNAGYNVSGSHCEANALKTTAPNQVVWRILKKWIESFGTLATFEANTPQWRLISGLVDIEDHICFDTHVDAIAASQKMGLKRYPENPSKNWGPLPRAKKQNLKPARTQD